MRSFHSPAQQDSLALFRQQTEKRRFLSSARPKGTKKSHPHLGRGWQDHQKHSRARSLAAPARCAQGNTPHAPAPPPAEYPQLRSAEGGCGGVRGRGGIEPCFPCVPFPKVLGLLGEGSDASVMSRLTTRRCPSASLRLRANPAGLRPPWALPFAPVHPGCSGGSALLRCHASPVRNGWLRSDSGQAWRAVPALCLSLTSVHPACSRRLGRFFLLANRGDMGYTEPTSLEECGRT